MNTETRPALTIGSLTEEFSRRIREELSPLELQLVNERNIAQRETHPDCCATHDFIDANQTMCDALSFFTGLSDSELADKIDDYLEISNAAWRAAKLKGFAP